jgi:DNA-binding phage protein
MKQNLKTKKDRRLRLLEHNTGITLSDANLVFKTFIECLREGDAEAATEVLAAGLKQFNKSQLEKRYHIPRRSIYNLMDRKVTPNLDLVAKVCQAIEHEAAGKRKSTHH